MNIISLNVENIKRIKAVKIEAKGKNKIVITGKNGNGKTSIMDSIAMALGGAKLVPAMPIRQGETSAKIEIELETLKIKRHWTSLENSYLTVETKEGAQFKSPQKELDKLLGNLSFDPLEFTTIEAKKRLEILREITKLDFTTIDRQIAHAEEQRKNAKKDGEAASARLKNYEDLKEMTPPEDIEKIKQDKGTLEVVNFDIKSAKVAWENKERQIEDAQKRLDLKCKEIDRLREETAAIQEEIQKCRLESKKLKKESEKPLHDISVFDKAIEKYHEFVANEKRLSEKNSLEKELEALRKNWKFQDDEINRMRFEKQKQIEAADMPIKGLAFGEGEVTFNGIPFNQLSTSEQIRVSMSIAMKQNPKLKIILIKNGSLLDDDAMIEVEQICETNGFQCWIERVSSKPEGDSIHISEGEVV